MFQIPTRAEGFKLFQFSFSFLFLQGEEKNDTQN